MHTNKDMLKGQVLQSNLLSPQRKETLLKKLDELPEEKLSALALLLQKEPAVIGEACAHVIEHAVESGDTEWLMTLDAYLKDSAKKLRRAQEGAHDSDDEIFLEHFFDAA
ncbi:MAG: hypothetical protein AAB544_03630 [Patescibacteria group bacterium]